MGATGLKIGICGGTFDPVHTAHLAVAELVKSEYGLDKVLFIPSGMPPHKDLKNVTEPGHRLKMVQCAVCSNPGFEAVSMEIERSGYTYTVDTLKELHSIYPKGTEFFYIIGADVVMDLLTWRNAREVFALTSFIAVMRPGFSDDDFNSRLAELKENYNANINCMEIPLLDISSTYIRERVKEGKSIKYLVDHKVLEYIVENNLYKKEDRQ